MTNLYGAQRYKENWENIDLCTLHAYLGLLLLAAVYRSRGECLTEIWDDQNGRLIFRETMLLKKFEMINRCLLFDDKNDRAERRERDPLAPIRIVFDKWERHLKTLYVPCTW